MGYMNKNNVISPIRTQSDHDYALQEIDRLIDLDPETNSAEGKKLEVLATLVESYEKENFPLDDPNPIDAIRFCMEERNLKQQDLVPFIGNKSKVSEVLSGKRGLTIPMIRRLSREFGIPERILLKPTGIQLETSKNSA